MKKLICLVLAVLLALSAVSAFAEELYAVDGEKLVVLDRDGIIVYLTGDTGNSSNTIPLNVVIENNSGKSISILYRGTVNGWDMGNNTYLNNDPIDDGVKSKAQIYIWPEKVDVTSFEEIETMTLNFTVMDADRNELFVEKTGTINFHTNGASDETVGLDKESSAEETPVENKTEETKNKEPIIIYGTYETLEVGSKGDAVKLMQQELINQGFLSGGADGAYGKGTAGAVSKFQESVGLKATGMADEETQQKLFGGIEVLPVLMAEPWFFNGGSDLALNVLQFGEESVTLTQITFDGNGRSVNAENEFPYTLTADGISIALFDGSEKNISFAANGSLLQLNNHEYWAMSEVNKALQGYWVCRYTETVLGNKTTYEEHIFLGDGKIRTESANGGFGLGKGEYYYFGPYEGTYKLGVGEFDTDLFKGSSLFFNIINNKPTMMRFTRAYESTDQKFPGENGYKF